MAKQYKKYHKYNLWYDNEKRETETYYIKRMSCPKNGEEFFCHTTYGYLQKYRLSRVWGNNGKVLGVIATPIGIRFYKDELDKHFVKRDLDRMFGERCWSKSKS